MKTGSSSIQHWLGCNAEPLRAAGFAIPRSSGERNLSRLTRVARAAAGGEMAEAERAWFARLDEELAGLGNAAHTVVLSGETMGQRLTSAEQVGALKRLLDPHFSHYRVIVYLRRQDRLAISRYSTALRYGKRRDTPLLQSIDYEAMLSMWADVFGLGALTPRLFERDALAGGDVVRDFVATAGLPPVGLDGERIDINPSLRPEAQAVLAELSEMVRSAGHKGSFHELAGVQIVDRVLTSAYRGAGRMPARAEAEAFYAPFRPSNERVRQHWFPERERLFDEDFSDYPEAPTPDPTAEAQFEVAMLALAGAVLGDARLVTGTALREKRMNDREQRNARRSQGRARSRRNDAR